MKKLRIAQVSPLWYSVPPKGYGGTELIASQLTEGLIKKGHQVTLFASGDSKTKGKLVSVVKTNLRKLKVPYLYDSYNVFNLIKAFSRQEKFDIIHTHIDVYDPIFRAFAKVPTITTLHNQIWPKHQKGSSLWNAYQGRLLIYNQFSKLPYISISNKYRKNCPVKINFAKTIYHGVNLKTLKFNPKPENCFVWLGRIGALKGLHLAIKLAKKMGFNLLIAGKVASQKDEIFFQKEVKSQLNRKIRFLGEIKSDKKKSEFLGKGKALLYPLCWEEPFGIVMAESMACGTPVIAFDKGAAPEIVKNEKTGFIVKNLSQMKKAILNIDEISRVKCRQRAQDYFSWEKMIEEHEKLYYQIIKDYARKIPLY